jgi:hypothetical protein
MIQYKKCKQCRQLIFDVPRPERLGQVYNLSAEVRVVRDETDVTGIGRDQRTNNGATGVSSSYNDNNSTSSSEVITNESSVSSVYDPSQGGSYSNPSEQITVWPGERSKTDQTERPRALKDTVAISKTIYRIHPHLDIFGCNNCNLKGDRWEMQEHVCGGSKK